MVTDKEVVEQLYEQVSWQDECEEIPYYDRLSGCDRLLLKTSVSLMIPVHYMGILPNTILAVEVTKTVAPELTPCLLIWGNPDRAIVESYIETCLRHTPAVHPWFIDVAARVSYSRYVTRALDGIDWQRSFENVAKGSTRPVWSWDE